MQGYFNPEKMFTYLKGFAMGKDMPETLKALNFARKLHEGQFRKGGQPYIVHPLTMACQAVSMGICKDEVVAATLLHDVVEDCNCSIKDLPCNDRVKGIVLLLTYQKPEHYIEKDGEGNSINVYKEHYYGMISKDADASIVKILDRCNNVSSMAGVFSKEKLFDYIDETKRFVFPLIRITKDEYPEYQNSLFILKYHIYSVLEAICGSINTFSDEVRVELED